MNTKHLLLLIFLCLLSAAPLSAQDVPPGFKNWAGTGLNIRLNRETTIRVSQLTAFNTDPYGFQFTQGNASVSRNLGERWNLEGGYARSWFKSKDQIKTYNRLFAEGDLKTTLGSVKMKHSLRGEWHFPQLRKYRFRFIYSNKVSMRFKELPGRPQPFIRQQLYYYLAGRNVTYYDVENEEEFEEGEEGEEEEEFEGGESAGFLSQPANGLHRYRLTLGVRFRLAKRLYATAFYAWQREFNTPFFPERHLNVPNQSGTKVQAPFNNYSLVGLSLNYTLKLY